MFMDRLKTSLCYYCCHHLALNPKYQNVSMLVSGVWSEWMWEKKNVEYKSVGRGYYMLWMEHFWCLFTLPNSLSLLSLLSPSSLLLLGADREGEGELKIFEHISHLPPSSRCLVVTNDSDISLFSMNAKADWNISRAFFDFCLIDFFCYLWVLLFWWFISFP